MSSRKFFVIGLMLLFSLFGQCLFAQNGPSLAAPQPTILTSSDGNQVEVTADGQLHVVLQSKVDQNNTRVIPLASGASFIGAATEVLNYAEVSVTSYADVDSATNGLMIQFGSDGITWYANGDEYTLAGTREKSFSFQPQRRYFRLSYTNGGLPQTVFNIETILHKTRCKPSSHRIQDAIVDEDDAELVKAVLTAEDGTGAFTNIRAVQGDTGYNLKVSVDQVEQTTNSLKVIDYAHAELHSGTHYMIRDFFTLAKNGNKKFLILPPDTTKWAHTVMGFEAVSSKITIHLYEEPTVTTTGTAVNIRNRNRNYANGSTMLVYEDGTVSANGTQLAAYVLGSGKGEGGGARDNEEIILKQGTYYLLDIQEANIVATEVNYIFDWYEHTNKN